LPPFVSRSKIKGEETILEKTAASLGTTQFVASWAITICGLITYPHSMLDPHAVLCLALALLGSSSHAIPFWLSDVGKSETKNRSRASRSSILRQGLCTAQSITLLGASAGRKMFMADRRADYDSDDHVGRYEIVLGVLMVLSLLWDLCLFWPLIKGAKRSGSIAIAVALYALISTIIFVSVVLNLKFKLRDCNMNTGEDNEWTFGQYLALFVLVAPTLTAFEAFLGR
jgi:amino acid transporter